MEIYINTVTAAIVENHGFNNVPSEYIWRLDMSVVNYVLYGLHCKNTLDTLLVI